MEKQREELEIEEEMSINEGFFQQGRTQAISEFKEKIMKIIDKSNLIDGEKELLRVELNKTAQEMTA